MIKYIGLEGYGMIGILRGVRRPTIPGQGHLLHHECLIDLWIANYTSTEYRMKIPASNVSDFKPATRLKPKWTAIARKFDKNPQHYLCSTSEPQ